MCDNHSSINNNICNINNIIVIVIIIVIQSIIIIELMLIAWLKKNITTKIETDDTVKNSIIIGIVNIILSNNTNVKRGEKFLQKYLSNFVISL